MRGNYVYDKAKLVCLTVLNEPHQLFKKEKGSPPMSRLAATVGLM